MTVFFLCGLWHGASWNFVIWGLFHGSFLVVERVWAGARRSMRLWRPLRHAYLLLVVMVGWVFFRADTLTGALVYLRAMAGLGPALPTPFAPSFYLTPELVLALAAGIIGSMPIWPLIERPKAVSPGAGRAWMADAVAAAALAIVFGASLLQVAAGTYSPFIYFRF